jgi:hypothetical protein
MDVGIEPVTLGREGDHGSWGSAPSAPIFLTGILAARLRGAEAATWHPLTWGLKGGLSHAPGQGCIAPTSSLSQRADRDVGNRGPPRMPALFCRCARRRWSVR